MIENAKTDAQAAPPPLAGSAEQQGPLWGARARDWAELGEATATPLYTAVLDGLGIAAGSRSLDVGCGSGVAVALAVERGAHASGLDASHELVAIARERTPRADLRVGEMEALPFASGAFDAVTGFNSFQFARDRVHALVEARRVTRAGGGLGFGVWGMPADCQAMAVMGSVRHLMPPPPPGTPEHVPLATPGVLDTLLRSAGWRPRASGTVSCPFVFSDLEAALRTFLSAGPMSLGIRHAGEAAMREALAGALAAFRTDAGYRLENQLVFVLADAP